MMAMISLDRCEMYDTRYWCVVQFESELHIAKDVSEREYCTAFLSLASDI
jgi:hypothetical protein